MRLHIPFIAGCLMLVSALARPCLASTPYSPQIIDQAVAEPLLQFNVKWAGWRSEQVNRSKALNLMALDVFTDPAAKASDGTLVSDRVLAQIRSVLQPGNEPDCSGGIMGRSHGSVANTFVLAKNTPVIWNALTKEEKEKIDWLMRAMAIAVNWGYDDDNNFKTTLDFTGNYLKTWNPNFVEPYMGILIAASLYFGEDQLNALFTHFDYDTYIQQFDAGHCNFPNVLAVWKAAGKERMENGTKDDGFGGSGVGVKTTFSYGGKTAGDLIGIYEDMAKRQYSKTVTNGVTKWGVTASLLSGSSPYLGQPGMMLEFDSADAKGTRSDAEYCYHSWLAGVPTRALLQAMGKWPKESAVAPLMYVGSEDLIYKLTQGYHSYSKGKFHDITETSLAPTGYFYVKEMWMALKAADAKTPVTVATNGFH